MDRHRPGGRSGDPLAAGSGSDRLAFAAVSRSGRASWWPPAQEVRQRLGTAVIREGRQSPVRGHRLHQKCPVDARVRGSRGSAVRGGGNPPGGCSRCLNCPSISRPEGLSRCLNLSADQGGRAPRALSASTGPNLRSEVRITRYNSVSSTERVTGGPSPLRRGGRAVNLRYCSYNSGCRRCVRRGRVTTPTQGAGREHRESL